MEIMNQKPLAPLPPASAFKTFAVYEELSEAKHSLGELRGIAKTLPNQEILIETLILQEALASSEIENIVTTQDEVFKASMFSNTGSVEAKEVARYQVAMRLGYQMWGDNKSISEKVVISMFRKLMQRDDGYRLNPVVLHNPHTREVVYTPPQDPQKVIVYMRELEAFINDDSGEWDPIIKMAIIHHQFESIHPFPDGNGRVGRMLNVLYLTHTGLLDVPILYLSRAINRTKPEYYRLLQAVREEGAWEEWVIYILKAVTQTAGSTLRLVTEVRELMLKTKTRMRQELPKVYSHELLNNLFQHPYTRYEYLERDLPIGKQTVRKYLKQLSAGGFVREVREGRSNYYINYPLVDIFLKVSAKDNSNSDEVTRVV